MLLEQQLFSKTTPKGVAYVYARTSRMATWLRELGFTMNRADLPGGKTFPSTKHDAHIQLVDCDGDFIFRQCYNLTELEDTLDLNGYYGIYAMIYWVCPSDDYATVISFIRMSDSGEFLYDEDFITAHLIDHPKDNTWPIT